MKPSDFLTNLNPCFEGKMFALRFNTMTEVWNACERPGWLFWILERRTPLSRQDAVRVAVACAKEVLPFVPKGEDRPRLAIEAAERWLADPTEGNAKLVRGAKVWNLVGPGTFSPWCAAGVVFADDPPRLSCLSADTASRLVPGKHICDIIRSIIPDPFIHES